jgi:hypothetical protein
MRFVDWLVTVPITLLEYAGEATGGTPIVLNGRGAITPASAPHAH